MRRIARIAIYFFLLSFVFSCQKQDLRGVSPEEPSPADDPDMRRGGHSQYNFIYATSAWMTGDPDYRLFTKEYQNGKLTRITASIRNLVTGGLDSFPLSLQYSYRKIELVDVELTGQTVGTFHFNHGGKLVSASLGNTAFTFHFFQPVTYKFYYSQGRLKEIKYQYDPDPQLCQDHPEVCQDPPTLHPYIKIRYDHLGNISSLTTGEPSSFWFEYDTRRKVKEQFYADEAMHDYFDFWFFLRYMDIFPELRPEYMLKRSVYVSPEGYLTRLEKKYHNHHFDHGRLLSYDVQTEYDFISNERARHGTPPRADESWQVYWQRK